MDLPGRPPATTFESIEAIALREPRRMALIQDHQSWTYEALYSDLVRLSRVLSALGVRRGQRVAVGMAGLQANLVLLIAAENLGAVTQSFMADADPDAPAVFALADWVFSDRAQPVPAPVTFVRIDEQFVNRVREADPSSACPRVAPHLGEPARITRTSGSSGPSKFMLLTRVAQEHWVRAGLENGGYQPDSRLLVRGSLVMNAMFARASACLRIGAVVLDLAPGFLPAHDITHVLALPALLEDLLKGLPPGYVPRRRVAIGTVGGFVSPTLRERAARVFGGRIANRYGANEVTGICDDLDAQGRGAISAGVDVRIIDDAGRDVAPGALGIIAVRTPGMVEGYLGDEAATAAAFRDGWFVSGDWGALIGPRRLRLAGRHDDLVVIGGLKVPARQVESEIHDLVQPKDCAVLAVNVDAGLATIGIALVMDGDGSREAVRQRLAHGLRLGATVGAKVIFLSELPRLPNAKVDRVALHRLFEAPPEDSL